VGTQKLLLMLLQGRAQATCTEAVAAAAAAEGPSLVDTAEERQRIRTESAAE